MVATDKRGYDRVPLGIEQDAAMPLRNRGVGFGDGYVTGSAEDHRRVVREAAEARRADQDIKALEQARERGRGGLIQRFKRLLGAGGCG